MPQQLPLSYAQRYNEEEAEEIPTGYEGEEEEAEDEEDEIELPEETGEHLWKEIDALGPVE